MKFEQLDQESYQATLQRWTWEAESNDIFPHEVERKLQWIHQVVANDTPSSNNCSLAYGIFFPEQKIPVAVCELVISRKTIQERWLKLLNVTLSPELELRIEGGDVSAIETAVRVYRTAVGGSFAAQLEHNADTLKLYGRNETMLKLLSTLLATLQSSGADFDAKKEGRWLVLRSFSTAE